MTNLPILLLVLFIPFLSDGKKTEKENKIIKLKPSHSFSIEVDEPSDLVYDFETSTLFTVSDNGYLAQIDTTGKLIAKSGEIGIDFEGITLLNNQIIAVDETPRKFSKFDKQFVHKFSKTIQYHGGRNKGFESITYIPHKNVFLTAIEKDPVVLYELDTLFNVIQEINLPFKISDVSALTFYNNYLWVLSDEDRTVHKCNLDNYKSEKSFLLPIINPEGIAFNEKGDMYICSDDMERLYVFKNNF